MVTVALDEASAKLPELVEAARNGEEVILTDNNIAVARLVPTASPEEKPRRQLGSAKDKIIYMADDFDAPLEDFAEYM